MLTDTASAPNPTIDSRITTPIAASSISVNTISTSDGNNSASSLPVKSKTTIETTVPITLEYLREQKHFCKLEHKQEKESTLMKKKHAKEQNGLGEQQSKIMSKLKTDTEKPTRSPIMYIGNQRKDIRYVQINLMNKYFISTSSTAFLFLMNLSKVFSNCSTNPNLVLLLIIIFVLFIFSNGSSSVEGKNDTKVS
jgi:hypothetical protein